MSGYLNDLSYNYTNNGESGNQLWGITDDAVGGGISSAYTYDVNGNMRTDSRKGLTIEYNQLNLPQTVSTSTETLSYTYDASGRKLKKSLGIDIRDYADGIEYNNGTIEFIQTAEGRIIPGDGSSYTYEYMLKDHLGNTRAAVKQDGSIVQVQDYYAFGLPFNANNQVTPSPDNRYKYNGKEWNTELSLNAYDYGARFYDPEKARWNVVDLLAENHHDFTPYNYTLNNPLLYIDPMGLDTLDYKSLARVKAGDDINMGNGRFIKVAGDEVVINGEQAGFWDGFVKGIPGIGPGKEAGEKVEAGDYLGAAISTALGVADVLTLGAGTEVRLGAGAAYSGIKTVAKEGVKLLPQGMVSNAGGNIVSFTTKEASTFFRVYSQNPHGGAFLTKAIPRSSAFAREGLALPSNNTASFIQRVTVPGGVTLQRSRALGAFGRRGGLEQFQILNFDSRIIFHPGVPLK